MEYYNNNNKKQKLAFLKKCFIILSSIYFEINKKIFLNREDVITNFAGDWSNADADNCLLGLICTTFFHLTFQKLQRGHNQSMGEAS